MEDQQRLPPLPEWLFFFFPQLFYLILSLRESQMSPSNVFQSRAVLNRSDEWILHIFGPESPTATPVDGTDGDTTWLAAETVTPSSVWMAAHFFSTPRDLFSCD